MKSRNARRWTTAQGLVEYALILPFFILLLLAMIESGRLFLAWHQAAGSARFGCRKACLWYGSTPESLVSTVRQQAGLSGSGGAFKMKLEIADNVYGYDSQSGWDREPPLPVTKAGVPVALTVTLPFNRIWKAPFLPSEVTTYEIRHAQGLPSRL